MTTELSIDGPVADTTADGSDEILQLFDLWNEALTNEVPTRVAELYGPGAVLVPTVSNTLRTTPEQILAYFEKLIRDLRPEVTRTSSNVRFFGDTAINSGRYIFHFRVDDSSVEARYTFAYHRSGSGWRISAHHSSVLADEIPADKAASLAESF